MPPLLKTVNGHVNIWVPWSLLFPCHCWLADHDHDDDYIILNNRASFDLRTFLFGVFRKSMAIFLFE
jgi:hypothetical protein